jgi:hypothetical protein
VKRGLPTLPGGGQPRPERGRSQEHSHAPFVERTPLEQPVIAVAHINQLAAASRLAVQLCAAMVREGASVSALVSIDNGASAPEAEAALSGMLQAGARQAVMVRKPEREVRAALSHALEQLAGAPWVVALGNALPQLYRPYFTVVVTGHRRQLTGAEPLVLQAQLEVTSPGEELATLLARRLLMPHDEQAARAERSDSDRDLKR